MRKKPKRKLIGRKLVKQHILPKDRKIEIQNLYPMKSFTALTRVKDVKDNYNFYKPSRLWSKREQKYKVHELLVGAVDAVDLANNLLEYIFENLNHETNIPRDFYLRGESRQTRYWKKNKDRINRERDIKRKKAKLLNKDNKTGSSDL